MKVTKEMLPSYCESVREKFNISIGQVHKSIPTLIKKENCVLHYRNLQLYIDPGLKVKKVHRELEFNQSPQLKQYIDFSTDECGKTAKGIKQNVIKKILNTRITKTFYSTMNKYTIKLKKYEVKDIN